MALGTGPLRERFNQVGYRGTSGDKYAHDVYTEDFLRKLRSTRRSLINQTNLRQTEYYTKSDLLYFWRQLSDPSLINSNGRTITRVMCSQLDGILTGAVAQFGSVLTLAKTGGSHVAMPGGAVNIGAAVGNVRANTALTAGLIVIAGWYLPDITDTTATMQVMARAANSDAESYILSYAYGGDVKTIARTVSVDTDDATILTDANNIQKGKNIVIGLRLNDADDGYACMNGQGAAFALAAGPQAYTGTYAGVRSTPNTVAPQLRYFEILKV